MAYSFVFPPPLFALVNIEPQNEVDAEMPEQIEPATSSYRSDRFCNDTKPFFGANAEDSECDDAPFGEAMDNDSDPSFKSGSEHAENSEYSFSNA